MKVGRNDPCPCGSGRKTKRCCGIERGPSEKSLARAFLSHAVRQGAEWTYASLTWSLERFSMICGISSTADLSLQVELPFKRARLARALLAKAEQRVVDRELASAALVDLASRSRIYLRAALLEGIAVWVGAAATPAGLRLAA